MFSFLNRKRALTHIDRVLVLAHIDRVLARQ